mgnify:CR=1 FL=1
MNSLFLVKSRFQRVSGGANKKLPIKSDEESSLVAGTGLLAPPAAARVPGSRQGD